MKYVSILNKCSIQYNALLEFNVEVIQKIHPFWQNLLVVCQLQINVIVFEFQIKLVTIHGNVYLVCMGLKSYKNFYSIILDCQFHARKFFVLISHFNIW